jgi:hypothetical protein
MLKEIKMTSKTKQMIALMEALNAVNGANKASQSLSTQPTLSEATELEEAFDLDKALDKTDMIRVSLPNGRSDHIHPDKAAELEKDGKLEMTGPKAAVYIGEAQQDEAFGMSKPDAKTAKTETMALLAADYVEKFGAALPITNVSAKEWFERSKGEMKTHGIGPVEMMAAIMFANLVYKRTQSESAIDTPELSESTIEKVFKKMAADGLLDMDDEGTYTSTLDSVLGPEAKKAIATSIAKSAKPGPKRDRAVANLSDEADPVNEFLTFGKKPTTPEETKAYILKKYAGKIKKVKELYKQYQAVAGKNMSRDGKTVGFKDATKSRPQWDAYRTAGTELQQMIKQKTRGMPGAGDLVGSWPDLQKILQTEALEEGDFIFDDELNAQITNFEKAVYSLSNNKSLRDQFKKGGIDLDNIARKLQDFEPFKLDDPYEGLED